MDDITTTSLRSANCLLLKNKCTIVIFIQIDHHHHPRHQSPSSTSSSSIECEVNFFLLFFLKQLNVFFPWKISIRRQYITPFSPLTFIQFIIGYYGSSHFGCFWYIHPSPGHLSSQCFAPESWQTLGIALFTAPPWLWVFDRFYQKRPVDWPNLGNAVFATFFVGWTLCLKFSLKWPNLWNYKFCPNIAARWVVRSVDYW